ncbi:GNAT family N-acetyltransferase [Actinomadura rayongensis]|uniref:GNAT family N-acetyltransferase n=1 Tax=Actinomadura rayongensis TaxID=1429076 RepID=A0A6I4WB06_9ACTN|nr:GNAT family N-acetyltransferase [Actinomadura rayongensis]MXQ68099.1 GNAT family N-acetyltransferase [Actinomadura rayongensis]
MLEAGAKPPHGDPETPRHPLDNPVHSSLDGPHAGFAERHGSAVRYATDVSPFGALPIEPSASDWADAAALAGPGGQFTVAGVTSFPDDWERIFTIPGVQLVGSAADGRPDPEAVVLTPADVPEMLDLVARTEPGPFASRTIELGTYLGIRRDGRLVVMAGERMHPPGHTEISAVCTDPDYRGHGLATRLIRAVIAGIHARGETPFLHAAASNVTAVRLYESLGFHLRREILFTALRVPSA